MKEYKESILSQLLTPGARERCNDFKKVSRIRLVKEDKAALIENQLIKLGQSGSLKQQVTEQQIIQMMEQYESVKQATAGVAFARKSALDDDW